MIILSKILYFLPEKLFIQEEGTLNMLTKLTRQREGSWENADMAHKGGSGGLKKCWHWLTKGEGGSGPPFFADIICEQPLISTQNKKCILSSDLLHLLYKLG